MTWEELCKKAELLGAFVSKGWIDFGKITFWNDGSLEVYFDFAVMEIAKDRTYEQMLKIMEGLR